MKRVLPVFDFFFSSVNKLLSGIASYAKENKDWHLNLTCDRREGLPKKWEGNGLILHRWPYEETKKFMEARPGLSAVAVVPSEPDLKLRVAIVTEDQQAIGQTAARYFLSCGHDSFCWYGWTHRGRGLSFMEEIKKAGARNVFNIKPPHDRSSVGEWLSKRLRALPKPCAVFCENDVWARELLDAALAEGIEIPKQLAILGVDDEPAICESSYVPLSSIENRLETVGYEAAALLDKLMDGAPIPKKPLLIAPMPYPVVRASTDSLASGNQLARTAVAFMRENRLSRIDVGDVAKAVCVSESGLRKLMDRSVGASPKTLLTDMRLEVACRLLRDGVEKLDEVALKSGFGEYQRLHAAFKARLGCTPSNFRERAKGLR